MGLQIRVAHGLFERLVLDNAQHGLAGAGETDRKAVGAGGQLEVARARLGQIHPGMAGMLSLICVENAFFSVVAMNTHAGLPVHEEGSDTPTLPGPVPGDVLMTSPPTAARPVTVPVSLHHR